MSHVLDETPVSLCLFADASFDPATRLAVVGFIVVPERDLLRPNLQRALKFETIVLHEALANRSEWEAILRGLRQLRRVGCAASIQVFTDCMAAAKLLERRDRLVQANFTSKRTGKIHRHADLYKEFFALHDELGFEIRWIKGHKPTGQRNHHERIFAALDRNVRRELREQLVDSKILDS